MAGSELKASRRPSCGSGQSGWQMARKTFANCSKSHEQLLYATRVEA
jgi:hypothetical protein